MQFLNLSEVQQPTRPSEQPNEQVTLKDRIKQIHRISISKVPQFMVKLSATYFRKMSQVHLRIRNFDQLAFQKQKQNEIKKSPSSDLDGDLSKKFDQLLSSPRLKLEVSESMAPELSSRGQQKQNALCLVCYEKESNMINQPCGHGGFCQDNYCMLCRKPVTHTLLVQGVENRESLVEVVGIYQGGQKQN